MSIRRWMVNALFLFCAWLGLSNTSSAQGDSWQEFLRPGGGQTSPDRGSRNPRDPRENTLGEILKNLQQPAPPQQPMQRRPPNPRWPQQYPPPPAPQPNRVRPQNPQWPQQYPPPTAPQPNRVRPQNPQWPQQYPPPTAPQPNRVRPNNPPPSNAQSSNQPLANQPPRNQNPPPKRPETPPVDTPAPNAPPANFFLYGDQEEEDLPLITIPGMPNGGGGRGGAQQAGAAAGKLEDKIDELIDDLKNDTTNGFPKDVEKNPIVVEAIDDILNNAKEGKTVTKEDRDRLKKAMEDANGGVFPNGAEERIEDLVKEANTLGTLKAIAAGVSQLLNGGVIPENPPLTGPIQVIYNPDLLAGHGINLGNGVVMIGTGGHGGLILDNSTLAMVCGLPVGAGEPFPDSPSSMKNHISSGILLLNPQDNGVAIHYALNARTYTMEPGFVHRLPSRTRWMIQFDRGHGGAMAYYPLRDGTYAFGGNDNGWELLREEYQLTIDNTGNRGKFDYMLDGQNHTVASDESKTHTSSYPMMIAFNRGATGKDAKKKIAEQNLTLKLAIDPTDDLWNLYPSDQVTIGHASVPGQPDDFVLMPFD